MSADNDAAVAAATTFAVVGVAYVYDCTDCWSAFSIHNLHR